MITYFILENKIFQKLKTERRGLSFLFFCSLKSFLRLICPLKWHLPFVPLLPCILTEYLEAPHPFIMGLNSTYLDQINNENDIIVVDIDTGELSVPYTVDLVEFPSSNLETLALKLTNIDFNNVQKKMLTGLPNNDWKSFKEYEKTLNYQQNIRITDTFLEFYVILFGYNKLTDQ